MGKRIGQYSFKDRQAVWASLWIKFLRPWGTFLPPWGHRLASSRVNLAIWSHQVDLREPYTEISFNSDFKLWRQLCWRTVNGTLSIPTETCDNSGSGTTLIVKSNFFCSLISPPVYWLNDSSIAVSPFNCHDGFFALPEMIKLSQCFKNEQKTNS